MPVKRRQNRRAGYWKQYYRSNVEKVRAKVRAWRKRNPEKAAAQTSASKKRNRKRINRTHAAWRKRTGTIAIYNNRRRERKLSTEPCDSVSANVLAQIIRSLPKIKCPICGKNMRQEDRTIDHVIPLSKGGSGNIGNLQIVHSGCNSIKGAKMPHELDGQIQINFAGRMTA